jgi:hypothetical protein
VIVLVAIFAPSTLRPYDPKSYAGIQSRDIYNPPSAELVRDRRRRQGCALQFHVRRARLTDRGILCGVHLHFHRRLIGIVAGFYGGRVENLLMRFTDTMLVIPDLPLIVVIVALTRPSLLNIIFVIGLLGLDDDRPHRPFADAGGEERKFVLRARAIGAGNGHIIITTSCRW